jgi:hypothetical protein
LSERRHPRRRKRRRRDVPPADPDRRGGLAALRVARAVKETTGIVGLKVVPNTREVLIGLYTRTLKEIEAVPKDEGYR